MVDEGVFVEESVGHVGSDSVRCHVPCPNDRRRPQDKCSVTDLHTERRLWHAQA